MGFLDNGDRSNLEGDFDQQFGNPQSGGVANVLQQLMASPDIAQGMGNVDPNQPPGPPMPSAQEIAPRQPRRSVLDIIGGLSDVVADVGGLKGGYQSGLDARTERERATVDDSWKNKFNVQKFDAGGQALEQGKQTLKVGENELSNQQRTLLGQAARGVSAVYARGATPEAKVAGVLKTWPMVARQLGLTPEQSQQFVQDFTADPDGTLAAMNASLTPTASAGSEPKEIAMYRLALAEQPGLKFNDFLRTVQDKPTTDYQDEQLAISRRREDRADADSRDERSWRTDPRNPANIKAAAGAGGADEIPLTKTQRGVVNMKLKAVPNLERQLAEVEKLRLELDDPKKGSAATGYLGGKIPGAVAALRDGGIADRYDKAVGSLQAQIRQFTKVPGEGSISDYETRLAAVGLPTRDASAPGREQALGDLRSLINGIKTGYTEMAGSRPTLTAPAGASPGNRPAHAPTPRRAAPAKAAPAASGWKVIGVK